MNEENNREPRTEKAEVVNEEVSCVSREEVKNAVASRSLEVHGKNGYKVLDQTVQQTING